MIHMKPIKVKFGIVGNVLLAQVIDMDESLRGKLRYCSSNGMCISSIEHPAFLPHGRQLCLWGSDKEKDTMITSFTYETEDMAKCALRKFTKCIQGYNFKNYDSPMDSLNPKIHWEIVE